MPRFKTFVIYSGTARDCGSPYFFEFSVPGKVRPGKPGAWNPRSHEILLEISPGSLFRDSNNLTAPDRSWNRKPEIYAY